VCFKTEKPSSLGRVEAGWGNFPTEKFRLLGYLIHNENTAIKVCAVAGVSNTRKQHTNYPAKTQSLLRPVSSYSHCSPSSFTGGFRSGLLFRNLLLTFVR